MEEFKQAKEDDWKSLKERVDEVKAELETCLDGAMSRFP